MKRFAALVAVVMLLIMAQPVVFATGTGDSYREVNETVYATTVVNVRPDPSVNHTRLGFLREGDSVLRTAIGSNGWSRVVYNGKEAYIFSAYLTVGSSNEETTGNIDYSQLTRQIAIANGLKQADYTSETWTALTDALDQANDAMKKQDQALVDIAQQTLASAIMSLEKMNYTDLETALRTAQTFVAENSQYAQWKGLVDAMAEAEALLTSGDQDAANAASARLLACLADLEATLEEQAAPEIIVQEVPVEVPPSDDYCNISIHRGWPVLCVISLILNLGLIAVIAVYVARKRKKITDDIPLVDYDIDDDI